MVTSLVYISSTLMSCSSTPSTSSSSYRPSYTKYSPGYYQTYKAGVNTHNDSTTNAKLTAQHREWRGTPYKYGGLSKRGVDCSGFVHLTYRDRFGINLPRSTELLSKTGTPISQRQLVIGDLVFFRTGGSKRHVGIYMGNRQFLHASTSKGVMISSLDNVYWRDKYWKAQRI